MFSITKLTAKSIAFISKLSLNNKAKRESTSIALARVLAYQIPLPSAVVEDVYSYYNSSVKVDLMTTLYSLKEITHIDSEAVSELVYKFYRFRYETSMGSNWQCLITDGVIDFFMISTFIDMETLTVIEENKTDITECLMGFKDLLADLNVVLK